MRILAIVADASLEVALSALPGEWEIVPVRDPSAAAEAAARADVGLVALGTTELGLTAVASLDRLQVGLRCLVVGDASPPEGTATRVLVRPFAMSELTGALRELATGRSVAREPRPSAPSPPTPQQPTAAIADEPVPIEAPAIEPPAAWALELLHEIGQTGAADVRPLPAGATPEPEANAAKIVRHAAATPAPGPWTTDAAGSGGLHRLRRRRRSAATPAPAGSRAAATRRVRAALDGVRDLEALVAEIPALLHPESLAAALVRETVDLLGAETAALYVPGPAGFRVAASHGLTPAEQAMVAPRDHPLLGDVAARLEAVLVAPVDLVRGIVSGVGGTNVEALMVAPLEDGGTCHGLLLAGRSHFAEEDLERFWLLADEASPGFAAACLIDRLRAPALPLAL